MQTKVFLVGAGAGDPKLLTIRAKEIIETASIVIYDALVPKQIISLIPSNSRVIYVGKRAGQHSLSQPEINDLLIRLAIEEGGNIVRLKGGDPFVFGRGGEEVEALVEKSIPFEIVPGISAGLSVPAYFGIPVTHRGLSQSVSLITASSKEGGIPELDWQSLARLGGTLVFYMGTRYVQTICQKLIEHGLQADTPAAIISQGTLPEQQILKQSAQAFASSTEDFRLLAPALLIVGQVVALSSLFSWYKPLPLSGKRILVTRSEAQASSLAQQLEAEGAEVVLLPTIEVKGIIPPNLLEILQTSTRRWIVFPSPNSVSYFFDALFSLDGDIRLLGQYKVGCLGVATSNKLKEYGIKSDFVPSQYNSKSFVSEFSSISSTHEIESIIIPCSNITTEELQKGLEDNGFACRRIDIYQNKPINYDRDQLSGILNNPIDWATFCSSSAANNLFGLLHRYNLLDKLSKTKLVAIGDSTAGSIQSHGLKVSLQAKEATIESMVQTILKDQNNQV